MECFFKSLQLQRVNSLAKDTGFCVKNVKADVKIAKKYFAKSGHKSTSQKPYQNENWNWKLLKYQHFQEKTIWMAWQICVMQMQNPLVVLSSTLKNSPDPRKVQNCIRFVHSFVVRNASELAMRTNFWRMAAFHPLEPPFFQPCCLKVDPMGASITHHASDCLAVA